jgi:hypothetical protein
VEKMVHQNTDRKPHYAPVCKNTLFSNLIFLAPVTEREVLNVTNNLKRKLSAGYDDMPEKIVKLSLQSIKNPLTFMFNLSLCTRTFPNVMKVAKVRPIYKKR